VQSPTPITERLLSLRKTLHIVQTSFLDGNEVLVRFSDGTAAIYEAEELEKLRPSPKQMVEDRRVPESRPTYAA
jgi:hypothetical protein